MKLNACSLLALFDCRILEEIAEKIFWRGKNVMTVYAGTEEYDVDRKVWEIPVIRWTFAGPTWTDGPHRLSVLIGWPSRLFLRTMASTHLRAFSLYLYMSKVAFCYVRCSTCMVVFMFHTRAARSAKRIVIGSTAFVTDEGAATYHWCSQFLVPFPILSKRSAYNHMVLHPRCAQ